MDEIVFLRETLRRDLIEALGNLDKAAEGYDASDDVPAGDTIAAVHLSMIVGASVKKYTEAILHRGQARGALPTKEPS